MDQKHKTEVEQITAGVAELSLPITVLNWNINGPGKADARRRMIGSVVEHIKPDVLLLQETKKNNISCLASSNFSLKYNCKQAEDGEEAQILYNSTFEEVSQVKLDEILEKMFPADQTANQLRSGSVPDKTVIKKRMCAVHLRHKRTKRELIFVSYHNIRKGGGPGAVRDKASQVCQIIEKIHESSKCCVIAGVDFNCSSFDRALVTVPDYDATTRRQGIPKVDFFLLSKHDVSSPTPQLLPVPSVQPIPVPTVQTIPVPTVQTLPVPSVQPIPVQTVQPIPVQTVQPLPVPPVQPLPVPPVQPIPVPPVQPIPPLFSYSVEAFDIFPQEKDVPFYKEFISLLLPHSQQDYHKALDHDPLRLFL